MLEWAYSGVNTTVPRNGGPECANYLSPRVRIIETALILALFGPLFSRVVKRLSALPDSSRWAVDRPDPPGKRALLVAVCLIWGVQIGFKFSSRTVIFLFNPCHITTILQIYLLSARPSKLVGAIFRFQMNCMNGAVLALAFPELDALNLPFEPWLYWIQHLVMMIIPIYLITLGGVYETEDLTDVSWSVLSYCLIIFYHFIVLQAIGLPTQVNLNHMLCPAIRDPFDGPWYRIWATAHQALLCPALSKGFTLVGRHLRRSLSPRDKRH